MNQYLPHSGNTDEHKTREFVAIEICITNHSTYVTTYCKYNHSKMQATDGMVIHPCCLTTTQVQFRAVSSLLEASFRSATLLVIIASDSCFVSFVAVPLSQVSSSNIETRVALMSALHHGDVLMKPFLMLVTDISKIFRGKVGMRVEEVDP